MQAHVVFWCSGISQLVLGIVPMGCFPRTPSLTNRSFLNAPDPLTGHRYLLHTPHIFEGTRGQTFVQNVPLPSPYSADCQTSRVCSSMGRCPDSPAFTCLRSRRPPLVYPANRVRSVRWPRSIRCYSIRSIDCGLWCWDAIPLAASHDTVSPHRGRRGVLSFSFEVRTCEGRVTLLCKSLRESVRLTGCRLKSKNLRCCQ